MKHLFVFFKEGLISEKKDAFAQSVFNLFYYYYIQHTFSPA